VQSTADPAALTCPECGGALDERENGDARTYVCHVGHAFAAESMVDEHGAAVERAIWSAVRLLAERESLLAKLAARMEGAGNALSRRNFEHKAELAGEHAALALLQPADAEENEGRRR
jgi:two-component system chemotaxis response regulator CheB